MIWWVLRLQKVGHIVVVVVGMGSDFRLNISWATCETQHSAACFLWRLMLPRDVRDPPSFSVVEMIMIILAIARGDVSLNYIRVQEHDTPQLALRWTYIYETYFPRNSWVCTWLYGRLSISCSNLLEVFARERWWLMAFAFTVTNTNLSPYFCT
jgi:hypothetical protein